MVDRRGVACWDAPWGLSNERMFSGLEGVECAEKIQMEQREEKDDL